MMTISEYIKISKESDECDVKVKVEEKPDTTLNEKPKAVINNTEQQIKDNVSGKELKGQELDPNTSIEFNTVDEPVKTGKELKGGDECNIEEVCQESDKIVNELNKNFKFLDKLQDEIIALESEIPAQLKKLEDPVSVTHSDVMVASECLKYKLKYLDIPLQNSKALNIISIESAVNNPAADLMICVEDEKTLLSKLKNKAEKIWEWIVKQFKKLKEFLGKIGRNIPGFRSKQEKFLKDLEEQANNLTNEDIKEAVDRFIDEVKINPNTNHLFNIFSLYLLKGGDVNAYATAITEHNKNISITSTSILSFSSFEEYNQKLEEAFTAKHRTIADLFRTCGIDSLTNNILKENPNYYFYDIDYNQYSSPVVFIKLVAKPSIWGEVKTNLVYIDVDLNLYDSLEKGLLTLNELRDLAVGKTNILKQIDQLEDTINRVNGSMNDVMKNGLQIKKENSDKLNIPEEDDMDRMTEKVNKIILEGVKSDTKNVTRSMKAINDVVSLGKKILNGQDDRNSHQ